MEKSYYQPLQIITLNANSALTTLRRFVKMVSGKVDYAGANEKSIGVVMVETDQYADAPIVTEGVVLVEVGTGGITENGYVTSDSVGKAVAVPNLSISYPAGATNITASTATPTFTFAGATLPVKINGIALDTVSAGGFARILLK